jgi:hypothetical protein
MDAAKRLIQQNGGVKNSLQEQQDTPRAVVGLYHIMRHQQAVRGCIKVALESTQVQTQPTTMHEAEVLLFEARLTQQPFGLHHQWL